MNKLAIALLTQKTEKGFTLVEVLVGILLILTFVGISTQALVLSTVFKVRGQELSEATTWMQEDLENIRFLASQLNVPTEHTNRCVAISLPTDTPSAKDGYGDKLRDEILTREGGSDSNSVNSPKDMKKESAMGKRPYVLRRVVTPVSTAPFNALEVRYAVYAANEVPSLVTDTDNPDAIATSYSEIIPNASFTCQ
ncbi:MAG: prepilin-type N-terminal cleavage/methylation domain-containing protein [Thermosynechococcaceae cyanobacterium]